MNQPAIFFTALDFVADFTLFINTTELFIDLDGQLDAFAASINFTITPALRAAIHNLADFDLTD